MDTHHKQYAENLCDNLTRWLKRKSRRISAEWTQAALTLMNLDLNPAYPMLKSLYSPDPRGRKPYNPVCMLRSLLLMTLLRYTSITDWVEEMRGHPRLAVMAGFASNSREHVDTPSVGAYYQFMDRLEDGEYQKPCEHYVKPSKLRKIKRLRNLKGEKEQRQKDKKADLAEYDSVTQKLKAELKAKEDQPRPDDLLKRLENILIQCVVIPSAQRGLLGDTKVMKVSGDGSALVTGANPHGKRVCKCREEGIYDCDCPRYYTDATADWGYDSYRDCYYFGHTYYQHVVSTNGHDLPLQVSISQASETDFTISMNGVDRLIKALRENGLDWQIAVGIYDAGHDAVGIYEYLMEHGIKPVIALNPRSGTLPLPTGNAEKVNEEGIPICPGGLLMRKASYTHKKHRINYNCPVKRPTHRDGEYVMVTHANECPLGVLCSPGTKMAPVVYVKTTDDPRLYPPIPRGTPTYKELMNLRTGCERSNAMKKEVYSLGKRVCRSDTHFLIRMCLVSIIEHAKAWLAEDKKALKIHDPIALLEAKAA
jgi:hypothetical protein